MLGEGKLNKAVPIPLYFQLKEAILNEMKNGTYRSDDLIPTEKELSDMFQISRTTVRQAITELVQEGWLYRIP
jgi:GntR family transcriptional regulator